MYQKTAFILCFVTLLCHGIEVKEPAEPAEIPDVIPLQTNENDTALTGKSLSGKTFMSGMGMGMPPMGMGMGMPPMGMGMGMPPMGMGMGMPPMGMGIPPVGMGPMMGNGGFMPPHVNPYPYPYPYSGQYFGYPQSNYLQQYDYLLSARNGNGGSGK